MKKLNYFLVLIVSILSLSLTSCLNTNSEDTGALTYLIVTVNTETSSPYFTDQNGTKYYPTSASIAAIQSSYSSFSITGSTAYMAFYYTDYNTETYTKEMALSANQRSFNITLEGYANLDATVNTVATTGASNDTLKTNPVDAIDYIGMVGNSLLLDINYYPSSVNNLVLFRYSASSFSQNSSVSEPDTLKFTLSYYKSGSLTSYDSQYYAGNGYPTLYYKAYPISAALKEAKSYSKDSVLIDVKAMIGDSGGSSSSKGSYTHYYCKAAI